MGLQVAKAVLETGGDVICIDRAKEPLKLEWRESRSLPQTSMTSTNHQTQRMHRVLQRRAMLKFPILPAT